MQWVFESRRSGSSSTQSLLRPRPMDSVPSARVRVSVRPPVRRGVIVRIRGMAASVAWVRGAHEGEGSMADITLAEFGGNTWLVGGEALIDDFLANTLSKDITIELIPCETKSQVHALWEQHCGPPQYGGDPWLIHPNIVNRVRRNSAGYE